MELLSIEEVAAALKVSGRTLHNWLNTGRFPLPLVREHGRVRWTRQQIELFLRD